MSRTYQAPTSNCTYGGTSFWSASTLDATLEECPIPVSVHGQDSLGGLGHVLAINDTILAAHATQVNATSIQWTRFFDRMGGNVERTWTSYLIFSAEGGAEGKQTWRPIMDWTRDTFSQYFNPVTIMKDFSQLGGMGAYSCANVVDGIAGSPLSPTVLWDAHFWWPYQGMFFPPTSKGVQWTSNRGGGEQNSCGSTPQSFQHGQLVSDALIRTEYIAAQKANMTMLSYFNFNFFGQNVVVLDELKQAQKFVSAWQNSSVFLKKHFSHSFFPGPIYDWQRSVKMDPNDFTWASWLVSQANASKMRIGDAFRGFVVDEPHLSDFSMNKDDKTSWCGRPCSATLWGWINVSHRVRQVLDETSQQVLLSNQINTFRVDSLLHFDGVFTETNSDPRFTHAASVAAVGLLTMGQMPGIVWTNMNDDVTSDVFHQQHLLFGVQPMAPYMGNDHAVQPGSATFAAYLKYSPVYDWMKGSRWWLKGDITVTTTGTASFVTNAFEIGPFKQYFVVMVHQTSERQHPHQNVSVSVHVNGWPTWVNGSTCLSHDTTTGNNHTLVPTGSGNFPPTLLKENMLFVHCSAKTPLKTDRGTIVVNVTEKVINSIDGSFLSFTLDTAFFCEANSALAFFTDAKVQQQLSLLMPFSIRVGGTQSDYCQANFAPKVDELPGAANTGYGCNYTTSQFKQLMNFSRSLGDAEVVFGLNSLTREGGKETGKWNGINAKAILRATELKNVSGWELGNEPELWWLQSFAKNISATEHAADFATLRQLLPDNHKSKIIGPDFFVQCLPQFPSCDTTYLQTFLARQPSIDVLTFHLYPWLGTVDQPTTPSANSMYNTSLLNVAGIAARKVVSAVMEAEMKIPVWMGEGSPDWKREEDGSALGHNFTFEFAWLDMLGQFAQSGVQRVYRQSLTSVVGGAATSSPPAYFLSLLWKKIMLTTKERVVHVHPVDIADAKGNKNEVIRGYSFGSSVMLLNTDQKSDRQVHFVSTKCHTVRNEWHVKGGPDVVEGKIHGLLVNGRQPTWNKEGSVSFGPATVNNCNALLNVEAGGVVFVEMSVASAIPYNSGIVAF